MANSHAEFLDFDESLDLSETWFRRLKSAQRSIKGQLLRYFKSVPGYNVKLIRSQGSKRACTLIRRQNGTVDFDYGIYFYPKPKGSAAEVRRQVYKALYGLRTFTEPEMKRSCVQVTYAEGAKIHFDVPIYYLTRPSGNMEPYLATSRGWQPSSPYLFDKWSKAHYDSQLTRIIRYLKAWANNHRDNIKMPSGVALAVLATRNFKKSDRDDICLSKTVRSIWSSLKKDCCCLMPVTPFDDLLSKLNGREKSQFLTKLDSLVVAGDKALKSRSRVTALRLWKTQLGFYFPLNR